MLSLAKKLLYNILMILLFVLKAQLGSFLLLLNSCFLKIYTRLYRNHIFLYSLCLWQLSLYLLKSTAVIINVRYSIC